MKLQESAVAGYPVHRMTSGQEQWTVKLSNKEHECYTSVSLIISRKAGRHLQSERARRPPGSGSSPPVDRPAPAPGEAPTVPVEVSETESLAVSLPLCPKVLLQSATHVNVMARMPPITC